MLNLFSKSKRILGLEIMPGKIRFVEVLREKGFDRVTAYGEADVDDDSPRSGLFQQCIKDVKKILKTKSVNISIDGMANEKEYKDVLRSLGLRVGKIVSSGAALLKSVVPSDAETSFLIVNAEKERTDFLIFRAGTPPVYFTGDSQNHAVISNINRLYIDWYDAHKEKIHHVIFSGTRASQNDFLDYVSRETKLPVHRANVFANLDLDPESVPILPRIESYKYAIVIGLALS